MTSNERWQLGVSLLKLGLVLIGISLLSMLPVSCKLIIADYSAEVTSAPYRAAQEPRP